MLQEVQADVAESASNVKKRHVKNPKTNSKSVVLRTIAFTSS